eukprot:GHVU01128363.1.p1 GENE.GHVU01128363.1~~GHVU01128363.1.p1  ORF type:complete len:131 (+),score=2.41 GHVU01128363.1:444-836(+)
MPMFLCGVCICSVRYFEEQPVFASLVMELVPGDPLHIVFRRHLHDSSTPPVNIPPPSVRLPGLPVSTVQRYTANVSESHRCPTSVHAHMHTAMMCLCRICAYTHSLTQAVRSASVPPHTTAHRHSVAGRR